MKGWCTDTAPAETVLDLGRVCLVDSVKLVRSDGAARPATALVSETREGPWRALDGGRGRFVKLVESSPGKRETRVHEVKVRSRPAPARD